MVLADRDSVGYRILGRMKRGRRSDVWIARDFIDLGTRTAVDVALHRLERKDEVRRICRGLYDRPRYERDVLVPPDEGAVLAAISRRDGVKVLIEERSAAQRLGLIEGTPSRLIVLTSGELEAVSLGRRTIEFRTVAPSRLIWAGRPAGYLVQAMRYLRKRIEAADGEMSWRIRNVLDDRGGAAIRRDLERGLGDLPIWLVPHVKRMLRGKRASRLA